MLKITWKINTFLETWIWIIWIHTIYLILIKSCLAAYVNKLQAVCWHTSPWVSIYQICYYSGNWKNSDTRNSQGVLVASMLASDSYPFTELSHAFFLWIYIDIDESPIKSVQWANHRIFPSYSDLPCSIFSLP